MRPQPPDLLLVALPLVMLADCGGATSGSDAGTPMAQLDGAAARAGGGNGGAGLGGTAVASGGDSSVRAGGSGGASIGRGGMTVGSGGGTHPYGAGGSLAGSGGNGGANATGSGGATRQCFPPPMTQNDPRCPADFIGYGHTYDVPMNELDCAFEGLACTRWVDTTWNYCDQPPRPVQYMCCAGQWKPTHVCPDRDAGSKDAATD